MKISERGIKLIKEYEGFRSVAYLCAANIWTLGYGSTKGVKKGDVISEREASERLEKEVNEEYGKAVNDLVKVSLTQNQFDALVSLVYNIGVGNFKKSTVLKELNKKNYSAACEAIAMWNKGGGRVLAGLVRRRSAEQELFNL